MEALEAEIHDDTDSARMFAERRTHRPPAIDTTRHLDSGTLALRFKFLSLSSLIPVSASLLLDL